MNRAAQQHIELDGPYISRRKKHLDALLWLVITVLATIGGIVQVALLMKEMV